jgi:hypothetical protein
MRTDHPRDSAALTSHQFRFLFFHLFLLLWQRCNVLPVSILSGRHLSGSQTVAAILHSRESRPENSWSPAHAVRIRVNSPLCPFGPVSDNGVEIGCLATSFPAFWDSIPIHSE